MLVATLAGALCGVVGVYVVLRGMSYIGHGLSHAIFGGAVASYVTQVNFYVGAGLWGVVASLLIGRVARRRLLGADAAIGVVTTASFALGLAIVSRYSGFTRNFDAALFGNILGVSVADLLAVAVVSLFVGAVVFFLYRPLLFTTFDPDVAEASGVSTSTLDALFSLMLAATIVTTLRILGVTLVAAALVIPPATARLLTDSFARMLMWSAAIGALSGAVGIYLSYYLNIASGPAIVLVAVTAFVGAFSLTGTRGLNRSLA
jgi:manganese/iron transport system permease protein/iron/zinc/copper transport system permease protein